jgi:hypothetical protein
MGIRGRHYGYTNSSHFLGQQTVEESPYRGRPKDAFNYKYKGGNRGLVAWLEEWSAELMVKILVK